MCGIAVETPDPQAMMRRAERALRVGEEIVLRATADDDDRTALRGLDRVHKALELCMKAVGLIGGDQSTVNVLVSQQSMTIDALFGKAQASVLRFIVDHKLTNAELAACAEFIERRRVLARPIPALSSGSAAPDATGTTEASGAP